MKTGDRVRHDFLGDGEITDTNSCLDCFMMVKFDKTPPKEYNMCENPTIVFKTELTEVKP